MEGPSPAGLGVGDVNFPRTRLLCDPPGVGWVGWVGLLELKPRRGLMSYSFCSSTLYKSLNTQIPMEFICKVPLP